MKPDLRDKLVVAICGGPSGTGLARPDSLVELASELGIQDVMRFQPPASREELVNWYRAATVCVVPSYSESFGLVAIEAQACGTPVIAANVGGLPTAINNGKSGVLVNGHDASDWAKAIDSILSQPQHRATLSAGALEHSAGFSWERTTDELLAVYEEAVTSAEQRQWQ
jgi:D-inositol-3-phosphate glycosyltransferase